MLKAQWNNKVVALKFQMAKEFEIETKQLAKIKHENIIIMYGQTRFDDNYVIVMEYAEGGALASG